jgi:hypothetical protein
MQQTPSYFSLSTHSAPTPIISWLNEAASSHTSTFSYKLSFEVKKPYEDIDYEFVKFYRGAKLSDEITTSKGFLRNKAIIPTLANYDKFFDEHLNSNDAYESATIERVVEKVKVVIKEFFITCDPRGDKDFLEECLRETSSEILKAIDKRDLIEITAHLETTNSSKESTLLMAKSITETSDLGAPEEKKLVIEEKTYLKGEKTVTTTTLSHTAKGREIVSEIKKNTESCEFEDLIEESEIKFSMKKI